ncbi:unnamed protein product [Calypogeia fissa]
MEWLGKDWTRIFQWGKEDPEPVHTFNFFSYVRSIWSDDSDIVQARDTEFDYSTVMALEFCVGLAYGIIVGVGLIMFWVYRSRVRAQKRQEKASTMAALSGMQLDDVRKLFPQEYFPYWIVMGKYEKVHWINHCVGKLWPFYSERQSASMKEIWEPWIDPYRPASISQISFSEFSLGSVPPVFLGVRMVPTSEDEIVMDVECQWQGDPCIILRVRTSMGLTISVQIKDVVMLVVLRIIFRPLVNELPGFAAFTYSIRKNRKFDFTLRLVGGDIATIPRLGSSVEEMIKTSILDTLMWPMRVPVPIIPSVVDGDSGRLQRHFNPRRGAVLYAENGALRAQAIGILDVKLVQAKELKLKKTKGNMGAYAFIYIRPIPRLMKRSKTISDDLSPIWNEIYEVEVEDPATQKLVVKILDEDADQQEELLGCCQVFLKDLEPGVLTEKWIRLVKYLDKEDLKYRGEVNLELLYRSHDQKVEPMWIQQGSDDTQASTSRSRSASSVLREELRAQENDQARALDPKLSYQGQLWEIVRGVLTVIVERADNLVSQDIYSLRDPYVVLKTRKSRARKQTKVVYKSLNPEWNQTFDFLVEDGIHEMLMIKVWDHDTFGRDFLGSCATTLTKAIHSGEHKAQFELNGVPSGVIYLTLKWISLPFEKTNQRGGSVH